MVRDERVLRELRAALRARAGLLRRRDLRELCRHRGRLPRRRRGARRRLRAARVGAARHRVLARGAGSRGLLSLFEELLAGHRPFRDDGGRGDGAPRTAAQVTPAAVEVENLRRSYGDREALAGLTFDVREGELFALLGPNGGGKSTLFRILATILPPTDGTARVLGFDVRTAAREVRRRIGVVFQHASVDGKLTIEEKDRKSVV